jgi:hypothetical protein
MTLHLNVDPHGLPLWFLVLSLFLPRLCIFVAWLQHSMLHHIPAVVGIIPIVLWLLVPRVLILIWIYSDQGLSLWFLIHVLALLGAWGGGGHRVVYRDRYIRD